MIKEAIEILTKRGDLSSAQMEAVMEEILTGSADTAGIVSFLTLLNNKGHTFEELTAAVRILRRHVTKINTRHRIVLDTCGTGGDKKGTFNISTAASFVASGAGIAVAKHGNRSVSSCCGSADILEELGIDINMDRPGIERCLDDIGIAFLFAQNLHPAMKYAMPARKQIGQKTIFNILGPLSNPACATHQLVGVYEEGLTDSVAGVLKGLGSAHALVVYGKDGLDEISTTTVTKVTEANSAGLKTFLIGPEDFGIKKTKLETLMGGDVAGNAKILLDVLGGRPGPARDIVLLNAGAAIYAADKAGSIKEAIELAKESIDSKKALEKLELLKEYSNRK